MIDPEMYTISVRKESVEGDILYVARVHELPDVEEYGVSYDEALLLVKDTIVTAYELCIQQGINFPEPMPINAAQNASGRITLRMPKTLHSNLIKQSELEDVSLNQYIVTTLAAKYGQCQMTDLILSEIKQRFAGISDELHKNDHAFKWLFKTNIALISNQTNSNTWNSRGLEFQYGAAH